MIEAIYRNILSLDGFRGLSRQQIHVEPLQTLAHSEVYRLTIDSPSTSLIVKRPGTADVAGLAERERRFYRYIAPSLPEQLVPRCLLAVEEDQLLIIEDLSTTHRSIQDSSTPTREECLCLVRSLATLHGVTGNDPGLAKAWHANSEDLPAATINQRIDFFLIILQPFIETIRDRFDPGAVDFITGLHDITERIQAASPDASSLIHGDAHFGNALYSTAPQACLIDWGMPMLGFGEIDLAHALALNLPRHLARSWQAEMMSAYLDQLAACGAPADAATFDERYRLGVVYSFVNPVVWWQSGVPEPVWLSALANSLDAARDIDLIR